MLGTGRYRSTTALEGNDDYTLDLLTATYEFGSPEGWVDSGVLRGYYETGRSLRRPPRTSEASPAHSDVN